MQMAKHFQAFLCEMFESFGVSKPKASDCLVKEEHLTLFIQGILHISKGSFDFYTSLKTFVYEHGDSLTIGEEIILCDLIFVRLQKIEVIIYFH